MRRAALSAAFCLLAGAGFAQDRATIDKLNDAFVGALGRGDVASVATMYTDDAYLLPPGADLVHGRNDIQAFWTAALDQISDLKLTAVDVRPLGSDAAREVGTFTAKTKGQAPQDIAGKYVVVWQKVDGAWKLATDIWNTNK
jgi:uncharacterized protein (TIGR02246 family)